MVEIVADEVCEHLESFKNTRIITPFHIYAVFRTCAIVSLLNRYRLKRKISLPPCIVTGFPLVNSSPDFRTGDNVEAVLGK